MNSLAAPERANGPDTGSGIWFWTWTLAAVGLVLVPAWFWLRRVGEAAEVVAAIGEIFESPRPLPPAPTIARLLWFDAKLLPNAIAAHGLAGMVLGSLVGLVQAAGVRRRAPLRSWVAQAALAWAAGSVVGFLAGRSYVFAAHPELLLDAHGIEFLGRMLAPSRWGVAAGVLVATIAQLRRLAVRPIRLSRVVVWPVGAALVLHLAVVAVVAGARRAELGERWRQQSVHGLIVRFGWQTDWSWTANKYEEACRERMPAACAAYAAMIDGPYDPPETFATDAEREQRVMDLDLLACAGGSGAGCAALANLYRTGRITARSDTWADLFDRHACLLGATPACGRVAGDRP